MALLDDILTEAGFSASEIAEVKAGKLCQGGSLDAASDKELSVKLAFHVNAPLRDAGRIFLGSPMKKEYDPNVESLGMIAEDGGDGSLDDFKDMKLTNAKTMDKLYMKGDHSDLNLSKAEGALFKKCKTHDEVEAQLRQVFLDRFRAYKKDGLKGIAPYVRGKKEFSPGDELLGQLEAGKILPKRAPDFNKYLMNYPNDKPDVFEDSFFWVNSIIDEKKDTIVLVHRCGMPHSGGYVYMERHFYVSRSHNCLQGIGAALPIEDGGVVLYATRTSTDQVGGFGGAVKRGVGNQLMGGRMAANFERARHVIATAAAEKDMEKLKV
ncbi:hypothetical protein ACHAXT_007595 [Thalassiosira profunda]